MTSVVDICNSALAHIGEIPNISSIEPPEGSAHAQKCARFYPIARDRTLEEFNWSFARKRAALATLVGNSSGWEYAYQIPSDCLKARKLLPAEPSREDEIGKGLEFVVEGDVLYTDAESPVLVYTYRETAVTKWSPMARSAVSFLLGYYLAGPLSKDEAVQRRMFQLWRAELGAGAQSNGNVDKITSTPLADHIRARR